MKKKKIIQYTKCTGMSKKLTKSTLQWRYRRGYKRDKNLEIDIINKRQILNKKVEEENKNKNSLAVNQIICLWVLLQEARQKKLSNWFVYNSKNFNKTQKRSLE